MKNFKKDCLKKFVVDYIYFNTKVDIYDSDIFEKIMEKKIIKNDIIEFNIRPEENAYSKNINFYFLKKQQVYVYEGYTMR